MKIISTLFYALFVTFVVGIAGLLAGSMLPIPQNIELKIVKSGSMEPAIPTGSLVVVKPQAAYTVGDVITFGADTKTEIPTTHRIISIMGEGQSRTYTTKGDANEEQDSKQTPHRDIIGRVMFHAPYVGFILDFARQPIGFTLLIAIPAGLVILEEILSIFKEIGKGRRRKKGDIDGAGGGSDAHDASNVHMRTVYAKRRVMDEIFVPMLLELREARAALSTRKDALRQALAGDAYGTSTALVLGLIFFSFTMSGAAGGTIAYFQDIERSVNNLFRAGEWAPLSNPQDIVLNEFLPNPDGIAYGFDFGNDASNMPQGEWIELFNNGDQAVDVLGWYMTDASGGVGNTHAVITAGNTQPATTIIPPGGWLVVYLNKPSLNNTTDEIYLYTSTSSGSVLIDQVAYDQSAFCFLEPTPTDENSTTSPSGTPGNGNSADCNQALVPPNKSYARIPDGTGAWVDPIPTPGTPNIPEPQAASASFVASSNEGEGDVLGESIESSDEEGNEESNTSEASSGDASSESEGSSEGQREFGEQGTAEETTAPENMQGSNENANELTPSEIPSSPEEEPASPPAEIPIEDMPAAAEESAPGPESVPSVE